MAKRVNVRVKGTRRKGRPQKALVPAVTPHAAAPAQDEALSLPPAQSEALALPASNTPAVRPPSWKLPKNSEVKRTVVRILALRTRGMSNKEAGEALGLTLNTVNSYLYRAGKNGWLENLDDPKDRIEHDLLHKVVRNLDQALDSSDVDRRDKVALAVARGTVFKKFDPSQDQSRTPMTVLAVRIEMPPVGTVQTIREGAILGAPNYVDAQVVGDAE